MNEYTLQFIAFLKLLVVSISAFLYGLGGIHGKWKRRFIAPFILTLAISLFALWVGKFSWWILTYYPLLVAALCLGYGSTEFWVKVRKRAVFGFACGFAALPLAIISQSWVLYGLHLILTTSTSVILGVFNPCNSARDEETLIGAVVGVIPLFMI